MPALIGRSRPSDPASNRPVTESGKGIGLAGPGVESAAEWSADAAGVAGRLVVTLDVGRVPGSPSPYAVTVPLEVATTSVPRATARQHPGSASRGSCHSAR